MKFNQLIRYFSVSNSFWATEKSSLATLRKKTGYTFANCKKALELHQNDLPKAEKWLKDQAQALGWSKATKLEGRNTSQGLVGILIKNNIGAMIEVNCETDFVAKNQSFHKFVETASVACVNYMNSIDATNNITKIGLGTDALVKLRVEDGKTLGDHIALMIGTVGENATLKRAICYKVPESITLEGYTHPAEVSTISNSTLLGKYGSIVAFKSKSETENLKKICQHVVGMNPSKIGDAEKDKPVENKDDEKCLIFQEYLLDPNKTVEEVLKENEVEVVDYLRFECGEKVEVMSA